MSFVRKAESESESAKPQSAASEPGIAAAANLPESHATGARGAALAVPSGKAPSEASLPHSEPALSHAAGPLKEMCVQLGQTSQERVELRVTNRGGEIRVAVRSAEAGVSQKLQENLHELVDALQEQGFRASGWRPSGVIGMDASSSARQTPAESQNSNYQPPQHGASQQERGQQDSNQNGRPRWVEELEINLRSSGEERTGVFDGLSY